MGDFSLNARPHCTEGDRRPSGVNRATLHDVAVIRGQSHDVLAVFGHVQKLSAILVRVGYPTMIHPSYIACSQ